MGIKRIPGTVANVEAYRPLLDLLNDQFITTADLCERWRFTETHFANLRKAKRGPPYLKLNTGGVRYRLSEVVKAEIAGTCGPLTLERVLLALAAAPIDDAAKVAVQAHIRAAVKGEGESR